MKNFQSRGYHQENPVGKGKEGQLSCDVAERKAQNRSNQWFGFGFMWTLFLDAIRPKSNPTREECERRNPPNREKSGRRPQSTAAAAAVTLWSEMARDGKRTGAAFHSTPAIVLHHRLPFVFFSHSTAMLLSFRIRPSAKTSTTVCCAKKTDFRQHPTWLLVCLSPSHTHIHNVQERKERRIESNSTRDHTHSVQETKERKLESN